MSARILLLAVFLLFATSLAADHAININTADKAELTTLTGIGDVKAQAIIDYRNANGPFSAIEDIMNVSGIGTATFNNIKDHITVGGGSSKQPDPKEEEKEKLQTQTQAKEQTTSSSNTSSYVSSYTAPPEPELFADAGSDRRVIVGADAEFKARAYNQGREIIENVRFSWNFGDGSTAEGPVVLHHFAYPARYAVVLTIAEERYAASDRIIVTAEPAELTFSVLSDGGVAIQNLGKNDLDLSRWIVRSFQRNFILPENSIMLSGETLRISHVTLGFFSGAQTEFAYPNGALALRAGGSTSAAPSSEAESLPPRAQSSSPTSSTQTFKTEPILESTSEPIVGAALDERFEEVEATTSVQTASASAAVPSSWKWWMGAFAISLLAGGSVFIARRFGKREWTIVEE